MRRPGDVLPGLEQTPPTDDAPLVSMARLHLMIAKELVRLGRVAVEGEAVKPRNSRHGHLYFDLRDRRAQLTVLVRSSCPGRGFVVDGERVRVTGRLEWLAERGAARMAAEEIVPAGEGAIAAAIAAIRRALEADGLLTRPRRPLPLLPGLVGVVCGKDAAVRADIESVIAQRFANYPVVFAETTVSGAGAANRVRVAMEQLDSVAGLEVIILARGGGDAASLLPFSDEDLCRSIAARRAVVVSAIGHDGDRPLSDEVADHRFGTPSLAAAAVFPERSDLDRQLAELYRRASEAVSFRLERGGSALLALRPGETLSHRVGMAMDRLRHSGELAARRHPSRNLRRARRALDGLRPSVAVDRRLAGAVANLEAKIATLEALDPRSVLARGYAVVQSSSGVALRRAGEASEGETLEVVLAEGALSATVESVLSRAELEATGGVGGALARLERSRKR